MLNFIVYTIYRFLQSIINIFPLASGTLGGEEAGNAMITLGNYLGILDVFIPLSALFACLTILFGIEIALWGFKTVKWVIHFIPFVGGKGNH